MALIQEIRMGSQRARELANQLAEIESDGIQPEEREAFARISGSLEAVRQRIRELTTEWEGKRNEWESRREELRTLRQQLYFVPGADNDELQGFRDAIEAADQAAEECRYSDALLALETVTRNLHAIEQVAERQLEERQAIQERRLETVEEELREAFPDLPSRELRERASEFVEDPRRGYQDIHRQQSDEQIISSVQEHFREVSDARPMTQEHSDAMDALSSAVDEVIWRTRRDELAQDGLAMTHEEIFQRQDEIRNDLDADDLRDWERQRLEWEIDRIAEANTTVVERLEREQNRLVISGDDGIVSTQQETDEREFREHVQRGMAAMTGSTSGAILGGIVQANGGDMDDIERAARVGNALEALYGHRSRGPGERSAIDSATPEIVE